MEIVIPRRFNGPPDSGNGGYVCGVVAELLGGPAEVTLRRPPPLESPLRWDGACLWAGEEPVAEGRPAEPGLGPPAPVSWDAAQDATTRYTGFREHEFPTCFVCGPQREDGLRIFPGAVEGRDAVAAPWRPAEVAPELVWAALDCPGAFAVGFEGRGQVVLGRMAARVDGLPEVGERCVVVAWPLGEDGRKLHAGTALRGEDDRLLGVARQTWILPRPTDAA